MRSKQEIILIGCGKAKQDDRWVGPARDLYTGCLFRARRKFAEQHVNYFGSESRWFILSASHFVVNPSVPYRPYNQTIKSLTRTERMKWPLQVASELIDYAAACRTPFPCLISLHMGRDYAMPLKPILEHIGFRVVWPVEGMSQGAQLKWYAELARMNGVSA